MLRLLFPLFAFLLMTSAVLGGAIEAITFAAEPGKMFLPLDEAADELSWPVRRDDMGHPRIVQRSIVRGGWKRWHGLLQPCGR